MLLVDGASSEEIKAYSQNHQGGPQPSDLRWDFNSSASSEWNKAVVSHSVQILKSMQKEEKWLTQAKSDQYWEDAISQKFNHLRSVHSKAKPRVRDDDSIETEVEVAARLVRVKEESLKKARMDS